MKILALAITSLALAGQLWAIPVANVPAAPAWLAGYKVRYPLHVPGERSRSPATTILARLPTGSWTQDDAADVTVLTAGGQVLPVAVLSHVADGHTLIQFMRQGNDAWYWAYVAHPDASAPRMAPVHEGMTIETYDWAGDNFESWPAVRDGLEKSKIIGCFPVAEVLQGLNYARPSAAEGLAVSFRGVLDIKRAGEYRFFVNSDDASFLFIDGYKVCERAGSNVELIGKVSMTATGTALTLTAGHHPFEIHQVSSNNSGASGRCFLLWVQPGASNWTVPTWTDYLAADYGRTAAIETAPGIQGAAFGAGLDETLMTPSNLTLSIMQFAAHGTDLPTDELVWDFGDGTAPVSGRNPTHIYFADGDYTVSLRCGEALPPFRQTIHVWPAPGNTSPFSAAKAIGILEAADWRQYDAERVNQMFEFLQMCGQPNRWSLLEQLTTYLLDQDDPDLQYRSELYTVQAEALARLGREADALALIDKVLPEFDRLRNAQVALHLTAAWVFHRELKETKNADERYKQILETFRGLEHPSLRLAAIRWGDLAAEGGDLAQAEARYQIADELGGSEFEVTSQAKAITRGAMLRIAEKKLRSGEIRETRALLDKIELHYPQQKLGGLYRYLRAETDRIGGRYEAALRSYEVLLRLAQWADFHDSAMLGVANCYYRLRDYERSIAWLQKLVELYPEHYEAQNVRVFAAVVNETAERVRRGDVDFADVFTSFEPGDHRTGKTNFGVARGLGVNGTHALLLNNHLPHRSHLEYSLTLPNLSGDAWYWVELWYRETLDRIHPTTAPQIVTRIFGSDGKTFVGTEVDGRFELRGTFGLWHKAGFLHKTPMTLDGKFTAQIHMGGLMEVDSVSIRRVTDQQYDALFNLIEGRTESGSGN
jgi:tetratricopeptide (TPR) repeat protein